MGRLTTTFMRAYGISCGGVTKCNRHGRSAGLIPTPGAALLLKEIIGAAHWLNGRLDYPFSRRLSATIAGAGSGMRTSAWFGTSAMLRIAVNSAWAVEDGTSERLIDAGSGVVIGATGAAPSRTNRADQWRPHRQNGHM